MLVISRFSVVDLGPKRGHVPVVTTIDDLITLEEASSRYGVPYATLLSWLHRGRLEKKGRRRFPAPGGGKVLVASQDVSRLTTNGPKRGLDTLQ